MSDKLTVEAIKDIALEVLSAERADRKPISGLAWQIAIKIAAMLPQGTCTDCHGEGYTLLDKSRCTGRGPVVKVDCLPCGGTGQQLQPSVDDTGEA